MHMDTGRRAREEIQLRRRRRQRREVVDIQYSMFKHLFIIMCLLQLRVQARDRHLWGIMATLRVIRIMLVRVLDLILSETQEKRQHQVRILLQLVEAGRVEVILQRPQWQLRW